MFTNQEIIAIVFRLINFAALIGIGFYLFKKYVMPDLLLSIARKQNQQDCLYTRQATLEKQQRNLDQQLQDDARQCEDLRAKIDIWKRNVSLEQERIEKQHNDLVALVAKRIAHIAAQKERQHVQDIIKHNLVTDMQKSLSDHFQDASSGNEYLTSILQFMNERAS